MDKIKIYTDGGSRGNPGPAGIGVHIMDADGKELARYKEAIGVATNNIAEYKALVKALELASDYTTVRVEIYMDSELIVKQLNGEYKVKHPNMKPLYAEVKKLEQKYERVTYTHVFREDNKVADFLVNEALDGF